jgi:(R,R)-butanediol dehydrogenase/meso-butanediol dehydrogenase/diacetyl reductase
MEAALVTGKQKIELVEMPTPEASEGKAVVDVAYCGICGTDLHAYQSGDPYNPAICGHEWSGNVSAVGKGVAHVKEGDRVAIGIAGACGQCSTCQRGDAEHCEIAFLGLIGIGPMAAAHGGFASAISIDASRLYGVQNKIDDATAAMLEPATIALHAVRKTKTRLGDGAVVIGAGPIGLFTLQCARAAGAGAVVMIEPQPSRRALAKKLGADHVIDPTAENAAEEVNRFFGAAGSDIVYECAGVPQTVNQSMELVRRGGVVSFVGLATKPAEINMAEWLIKEASVVSALGYLREEFEMTQGLIADGRLQMGPMHTSTVSLAEISGAFDKLADAPEEVKILVDPRL